MGAKPSPFPPFSLRGDLFRFWNFASLSPEEASWEKARVAILPIPYDSTASYRSGARDGPRAIITASQELELYDPELEREISAEGIFTLPEVEPSMASPEAMAARVEEIAKEILARDRLLVGLGGEHSLTLGLVRACREKYPGLGVLFLDAHADFRDEYQGTKFGHASVGRRLWEGGPVVLAGVRSLSQEEHSFLREKRVPLFWGDSLPSEEIVALLPQDIYVSVDLDVLDPGIMAAVGNPQPGGLGWQQVLSSLRQIARRRRVVGLDVMELCPPEGPGACAFLAAKLVYKLIGYATQGKG